MMDTFTLEDLEEARGSFANFSKNLKLNILLDKGHDKHLQFVRADGSAPLCLMKASDILTIRSPYLSCSLFGDVDFFNQIKEDTQAESLAVFASLLGKRGSDLAHKFNLRRYRKFVQDLESYLKKTHPNLTKTEYRRLRLALNKLTNSGLPFYQSKEEVTRLVENFSFEYSTPPMTGFNFTSTCKVTIPSHIIPDCYTLKHTYLWLFCALVWCIQVYNKSK